MNGKRPLIVGALIITGIILAMPNFPLSDSEIEAIESYLESLEN